MLGDVRARKYSKTGARTRSKLEKFAFDTTLNSDPFSPSPRPIPTYFHSQYAREICAKGECERVKCLLSYRLIFESE